MKSARGEKEEAVGEKLGRFQISKDSTDSGEGKNCHRKESVWTLRGMAIEISFVSGFPCVGFSSFFFIVDTFCNHPRQTTILMSSLFRGSSILSDCLAFDSQHSPITPLRETLLFWETAVGGKPTRPASVWGEDGRKRENDETEKRDREEKDVLSVSTHILIDRYRLAYLTR